MNFFLKNKILVLIFIIAAFLRFYKLSDYPIHLGHDEVTQLYDAISIAKTGNDIYGNHLPFIFKSANDFKPPFYTYTTVLAYKIFGWQDITIRIPGAVFGTLTVLAIYFFVLEFLKNKEIALLSSVLSAISPFEIFYSRKSFENQAGIILMLLGFTLLKKKRIFWGMISLGISSYVYFAQAVLIPILIVVFFVLFWKESKKYLIKALIVFLLVVSPLYYIIYTNPDARNRSQAVFITQDSSIGKINKLKLIVGATTRYVNQFNFKYLFLDGLDMTESKKDVGPLFPVTIPFLLFGIYLLIKEKKNKLNTLFIFAWILITLIPSALTFEKSSPHRGIAAFSMLNIISAVGIYYFYKKILSSKKSRKMGKIVLLGLIALFMLNFAFFAKRYIVNLSIERSEALHYPFKDVSLYAWENYDKYDTIIFDPKFGQYAPWIGTAAHYYLAYYGHYDPALMQKEFKIGDQEFRETKFGKFSIRAVYWPNDKKLKKTLIIASPWSLPIEIKELTPIQKIFYFKTTAEAFYAISL